MSIELFRFLWSNFEVLRLRIFRRSIMRGGSEGPNWILFAGGAAVTALSYIIGRRQKHAYDDRVEERQGKSGKAQLANHKDGFESGYTSKACSRQDAFGSVDSSSIDNSTRLGLPTGLALVQCTSTGGLDDAFHANNHQDRQRSPLSAKCLEEERSSQSTIPSTQEDVRRSNPQGVQISRTAKRDMVLRLRKQLKSRDEMILSMQVQISEYEKNLSVSDAHVSELQARLEASERSFSLSDSHVSELQARLEASGRVLSDLDKDVRLLRNQLADYLKFDAKVEDCNQPAAGGAELITSCGDKRRDINATLLEFKKFRELLDRLKDETTAREIGWQALSREHISIRDKVDHLECALKEQRMVVSEKQLALNMKQAELVGVTSKLQDIQHLLQAQIEETESLRQSKAKLETRIQSLIKTQDVGEPEANTMKADKLIKTRDINELESNAPIANGLSKAEDIDELESNASRANGISKTEDIDELESNASRANGLIKTESVDDSEAYVPPADRLMESQDYDLVKIFDSVSESGDSIDSEFDEMLDGTLSDLVKMCSTSVTPASTPKSSVLSPNSGSKKSQYF